MSDFAAEVARLLRARPEAVTRLAGGDPSEILVAPREDGRLVVAKRSAAPGTEAAMLAALRDAGLPVPALEGEHEGILLLEHVPNDALFTPRAWSNLGHSLAALHRREGRLYGWPLDHALGSVLMDNRERSDWPGFWGEQRLLSTAALLDRPWRERVEPIVRRIADLLPAAPSPSLLHGDLWTGNILMRDGEVVAFIDPSCYHGHAEVDLAMLALFDVPPPEFIGAYGELEPGWEERRSIYQLFPALVHLRLFGAAYAPLVSRLLDQLEP